MKAHIENLAAAVLGTLAITAPFILSALGVVRG
jgi:hypothetical protein